MALSRFGIHCQLFLPEDCQHHRKVAHFTLMPSGARSKIRASQRPIEITRFFPGLVRRAPPMPATMTGACFGTTSHGIAGAFVDGLSQAFIGVGHWPPEAIR